MKNKVDKEALEASKKSHEKAKAEQAVVLKGKEKPIDNTKKSKP